MPSISGTGVGKDGRQRVVIIGSGIGGTATAARLAKAGLEVVLLEKNNYSGGRCSLLYADSDDEGKFRFDQGPSFYLMHEVFEEMFNDLDETTADHYTLKKCEPNYYVHYHDGECVTLSSDMAVMKKEVERFEGKDGWVRFLKFMDETHVHYEVSLKEVLHRNFPNIRSALSLPYLLMAEKLHVFDRLFRRCSKYFYSERLRRAFTFSSMYLGMSPYDSPATYSLLQYTELAQGIWYPIGGYNKVVQCLERIAVDKYGATFRYNSPVAQITQSSDGKRANGVVLESGEKIEADLVVSNADLLWTYQNLLPSTPYSTKLLKNAQLTCSSISFYWGLKKKVEGLSTHNIFLAEDYQGSFDRIFDDHSLPDEPSFYVNVPSRIDPSAAPEGKDTLVILVPVGHLLEDKPANGAINVEKKGASNGTAKSSYSATSSSQDWDAIIARARSEVVGKLTAKFGEELGFGPGEDFESLIEKELVNTPQTWRDNLNLYKGSILGMSHNIMQVLCLRPRLVHDTIKQLYFVGASTHPGTGVPVVICGAKLTCEQILNDLSIPIPWTLASAVPAPKVDRSLELNKLRKPVTYWYEYLFTLLCMPIIVAVLATRILFRIDMGGYFEKLEQ